MTDPAIALIQNMANRIFDLVAAVNVMDDGDLAAGTPVRPCHIFKQFSRRPSCQRRTGKRTFFNFQVLHMGTVNSQCQFASFGYREQTCIRNV